MQALDTLDHALHWETARQNRILQQAADQRKKQGRADQVRYSQDIGADTGHQDSSRASGTQTDAASGAVDEWSEWSEKLRQIPEIRSALMPLDEAREGGEWSLPFSLPKADVEPWLSFMRGYNGSRLFLDGRLAGDDGAAVRQETEIDYAVLALLNLKQVPLKVILEPPVQINRQVEYQNLEADLRFDRDPMQLKTLLKFAQEIHEKQLTRAVDLGRAMGNSLHDALMGEGHANLVNSWARVHRRKPTIEELHLMLTTGRVEPRQDASASAAPLPREPRWPEPARAAVTSSTPSLPSHASSKREDETVKRVPPAAAPAESSRSTQAVSNKPAAMPLEGESDEPAIGRTRRLLWYVLHAAVLSAAILAYLRLS